MQIMNVHSSKTIKKRDKLEISLREARNEPVVGLIDFSNICENVLDNEELKLLIKLLETKVK